MTANCVQKPKDTSLMKIAFVSPGYKPVPDVSGGAVEHLMTQIIEENERSPRFYFELYTITAPTLESYQLKYTHVNQIKDFRKTFFLRAFSFVLNGLFSLCRSDIRFNYFALRVVHLCPNDICFMLVENDAYIFKQIRQKMKKMPLVFHLHNDFDTVGEMQKTTEVMKYVAANATEIWTVSDYLRCHLLSAVEHISPKKVRVLENGIDRERFLPSSSDAERAVSFRQRHGIQKSSFVMLYSGRILKQKGVYELLDAVSRLPEDVDCTLVVAGDLSSAPDSYRKKLEEVLVHTKHNVVFTGYIPQNEMQDAYASADIVAIPSQWQEAFCLVALEAATHCKPIVASISGGMADILDERCAKMVALGNGFVERFAEAILELYHDERLRTQIAENAGRRSMLFPDREQYFRNFCRFAEEFISQKEKEPC